MKKENKSNKISGAIIRKLREDRGLTIKSLSQATGINYGCLSQYERGFTKYVSTAKVLAMYSYLMSLPMAETPLVTTRGGTIRSRSRKSGAVKKAAEKITEAKPEPAADPKPVEQKTAEPEPGNGRQIRNQHELIRETDIRVLRECRHLIAEIDCSQTPAVVRTADVQQLVTLVNFLKENWGYLQ